MKYHHFLQNFQKIFEKSDFFPQADFFSQQFLLMFQQFFPSWEKIFFFNPFLSANNANTWK